MRMRALFIYERPSLASVMLEAGHCNVSREVQVL